MSDRPKPKSSAVLKNLPRERQEQIAEWCAKPNDRDSDDKLIPRSGGLAFARSQLAADGLTIGLQTLSEFYAWWQLAQDLDLSELVEQQVLERTGDLQKSRRAAEATLLRLGLARQDPELIATAAKVHDGRRKLDLDEASGKTKAAHGALRLEQTAAALKLDREKFEAALRTKLEAAYAALAEEFKNNPVALRLFREAQALLPPA